jgi:hypothetical protein
MSGKVEHVAAASGRPIGQASGQERFRVLALGAAIVVMVAVYFGMRSPVSEPGRLLPYQMLMRDLVTADQGMFNQLKQSLLDAEATRNATGRWPDAPALSSLPNTTPGGAPSHATYAWRVETQGVITHYVGVPGPDASAPAWMIAIKEPEPGVPTDTAPNDEEHHRLMDGTVLHVSVWTHRFGAQVDRAFLPQPEGGGWTQVLVAPLNPLAQSFGPMNQPPMAPGSAAPPK